MAKEDEAKTANDEAMIRLGRRLLHDTAGKTEAGRYAAQIGEMLYNGIGGGRGRAQTPVEKKNYEDVVVKLTKIQGYLEGLAMDAAKKLLGVTD